MPDDRMQQAEPFGRPLTYYSDTRGFAETPLPFSAAIIQGLAPGGGLFVPQQLPRLSLDEVLCLAKLPYARQAADIYRRFGVDFSDAQIDSLMSKSYSQNFSTEEIAPVVEVAPQTFVLELFHGPTAAFKDMALQCLPQFLSAALERNADSDMPAMHLILVATSGDTGSAALDGFRNLPNLGIIVCYPRDGVSELQRRQMAAAEGDNIGVVAIDGNFDDCQNAVKATFNDAGFAERLLSRGIRLTSANSINWGRLLPQVVYYASAYSRLVAEDALAAGGLLDVCVPTGNFGDILAAWYARAIGVPLGRLYCASNENRVLSDFISSGVYDISDRQFKLTPSPSMDILVSSNLERQLFELNGHNSSLIRQWMQSLQDTRRFEVDAATFAAMSDVYLGDWVSNEECLTTIQTVFEQHRYLLDPHTAVAWKVAERLRPVDASGYVRPMLITATAHWAKFAEDVYRALAGIAAGGELPAAVSNLPGGDLIALIQKEFSTGPVPKNLLELDSKPLRFTDTSPGTRAGLELAILDWLDRS